MCMSIRTYRRNVNLFESVTRVRPFVFGISVNWPSNRNWQTKVLDSLKYTQFMCKSFRTYRRSVNLFGSATKGRPFVFGISVRSTEHKTAKFCFVNSNYKKAFLIVDRGRKAKSNFLQNVFKRSTMSHAYLSPPTHTA